MGSKEEHGQIFSRSGAGRCYAFARRCRSSPAAFRRGIYAGPVRGQSALTRAASRDNLRATVFLCITPLVIARCSSGCAS